MLFRQIHLDFHTSELIEDVGKGFVPGQFRQRLLVGRVQSMTLFAKCHHGWSTYPSQVNEPHPHLSCNLLGEQVKVCRELGVGVVIYLSAGADRKELLAHPEYFRKGTPKERLEDSIGKYFIGVCTNTPYLEKLRRQVIEVVHTFRPDGLFFDICAINPCFCDACNEKRRAVGKALDDEKFSWQLAEETYRHFVDTVNSAARSVDPNIRIFHNGGHIHQGREDLFFANTHFELESLPTGGWGYDHFPFSAKYVGTKGLEFLSMTGRFHRTWGEFGGYKHPNALCYETALALAMGAGCSIGDQLHPDGEADETTYALIGKAYEEICRREIFCDGLENIADVALLSAEACFNELNRPVLCPRDRMKGDVGLNRILLEGQILYDVVDSNFDPMLYRLVIINEDCELSSELVRKLRHFVRAGGKILAAGRSVLSENNFLFDFDADAFSGESEYSPSYFLPDFDLPALKRGDFLIGGKNYRFRAKHVLANFRHPYFNREENRFCSHANTPSAKRNDGPAICEGGAGIYVGMELFSDYANSGTIVVKQTALTLIARLLNPSVSVENAPSSLILSYAQNHRRGSRILQFVYGIPTSRGNGVQIVEDLPKIGPLRVRMRLFGSGVSKVLLQPEGISLEFNVIGEEISFVLPEFRCHAIVELIMR